MTSIVRRAREIARPVRRAVATPLFRGATHFWDRTYRTGGDSGHGSSGHLAEFKADVLNRWVRTHGFASVLELGCGDGRQLALAAYPRYIGLDISRAAIDLCRQRFVDDDTKSFLLYDPARFHDPAGFLRADLAISLDVLFHAVDERDWELHLQHLFGAAGRAVVVYAPDADRPTAVPYSRVRPFTPWVAAHLPEWRLVETIPNPWPKESWSDFHLFLREGALT